MSTSLTNTNVTFNDATTCQSGKAVAKAWAFLIDSNLTIGASYNISSIGYSGGTYTVNFTPGAVNNATYVVIPVCYDNVNGDNIRQIHEPNATSRTSTSFIIQGQQGQGGATVASYVKANFVVLGDS